MEILSNMVSIFALIIGYGFIRRWERIKHEEGEKYKNKTEVHNSFSFAAKQNFRPI